MVAGSMRVVGLSLVFVLLPLLATAESMASGEPQWKASDRQQWLYAGADARAHCPCFSTAAAGFPGFNPVQPARVRLFALSQAKHILPFTPILATE